MELRDKLKANTMGLILCAYLLANENPWFWIPAALGIAVLTYTYFGLLKKVK